MSALGEPRATRRAGEAKSAGTMKLGLQETRREADNPEDGTSAAVRRQATARGRVWLAHPHDPASALVDPAFP